MTTKEKCTFFYCKCEECRRLVSLESFRPFFEKVFKLMEKVEEDSKKERTEDDT